MSYGRICYYGKFRKPVPEYDGSLYPPQWCLRYGSRKNPGGCWIPLRLCPWCRTSSSLPVSHPAFLGLPTIVWNVRWVSQRDQQVSLTRKWIFTRGIFTGSSSCRLIRKKFLQVPYSVSEDSPWADSSPVWEGQLVSFWFWFFSSLPAPSLLAGGLSCTICWPWFAFDSWGTGFWKAFNSQPKIRQSDETLN